jgi:hypothetical protein
MLRSESTLRASNVLSRPISIGGESPKPPASYSLGCNRLTHLELSFKSERYLGANPEVVRATRKVHILADSPPIGV